MGYNTESTEWPTFPVPTPVKNILDRLYNLLDNPSPDVGNILADEIFAGNAEAQFGPHVFKGQGGKSRNIFIIRCQTLTGTDIRKCRDNAWVAFKSRRHYVRKVFISNENANDLLYISHVDMELKNGNKVSQDFIGRVQLVDAQKAHPKLKSYSIWAVCDFSLPCDFCCFA